MLSDQFRLKGKDNSFFPLMLPQVRRQMTTSSNLPHGDKWPRVDHMQTTNGLHLQNPELASPTCKPSSARTPDFIFGGTSVGLLL
ncbi:hypothetical protein Mapa_011319 [Marchantia paleacea]|nr:hypothetical protein Mapa_011319 [Marchantia paleacea]